VGGWGLNLNVRLLCSGIPVNGICPYRLPFTVFLKKLYGIWAALFFKRTGLIAWRFLFVREALNTRSKKPGKKTGGLSRCFFETAAVPLRAFSA
jgi:hypothetical protein